MKGKPGFGVLDVALVLLLMGAAYLALEKDAYFEVKGDDITGASATFKTLQGRGYCVDAEVKGFVPGGEVEVVKGRVVDGSRSRLYVFDGSGVVVLGAEPGKDKRVPEADVVPADLIPLSITMRTVECEWVIEEPAAEMLSELKVSDGFVSFYGIGEGEVSAAEALWMSRRLSDLVSGEVQVSSRSGVLDLYAQNLLPGDLKVVLDEAGDLKLSDITVKRYK